MLDKDTQKWLHDHSQKSKEPHRLNGIHVIESEFGNLAVAADGFRIAYVPTDLEKGTIIELSKYPVSDGKFPDLPVFFREYQTEAFVDTSELFYALHRMYTAGLEWAKDKYKVTALVQLEKQDIFNNQGIVRIILNTTANQVIAEAVVSAFIAGESRWAKLNLYWMIQALGGWGKAGKKLLHKFDNNSQYKPTISFKRDYDNDETVIGMNYFYNQVEIRSHDSSSRGVILMPYHLPDKVGCTYQNRHEFVDRNPIQLLELKQPTRPTYPYDHANDTSSINYSTPIKNKPFVIDDLQEFVDSHHILPSGYTLYVVYRDRFGWSMMQRSDHTAPQCIRLMKYVYDEDGNQTEELDLETTTSWLDGRFYVEDARSDSMSGKESDQALRIWLKRSQEDEDTDLWWSVERTRRSTGTTTKTTHVEVPALLVEQFKALRDAMQWAGVPTELSYESNSPVDPDRQWHYPDHAWRQSPYKRISLDHVKTTAYKWKLVNLQAQLELAGLWPNENQPYYNSTKNDTYDAAENVVRRQHEYTRSELASEVTVVTNESFFIEAVEKIRFASGINDYDTIFKYYKIFQPYLYAWLNKHETDPVGVLVAITAVRYWNPHGDCRIHYA